MSDVRVEGGDDLRAAAEPVRPDVDLFERAPSVDSRKQSENLVDRKILPDVQLGDAAGLQLAQASSKNGREAITGDESKTDAKPGPKAEAKGEAKPDAKAEAKGDAKEEVKAEAKPADKPESGQALLERRKELEKKLEYGNKLHKDVCEAQADLNEIGRRERERPGHKLTREEETLKKSHEDYLKKVQELYPGKDAKDGVYQRVAKLENELKQLPVEATKLDLGRELLKMPDGKYKVTGVGPDGKPYDIDMVDSGQYVEKPAGPTRAGTPGASTGGQIINESGRPLLALGKADGHRANQHGDEFLRVLPSGTKDKPHETNPYATDYDAVVLDYRYQPVALPDGKVLMPSKVPAGVEVAKIGDTVTGTVTLNKDGGVVVSGPWRNPGALLLAPGISNTTVGEFTGDNDVVPQTRGDRVAPWHKK